VIILPRNKYPEETYKKILDASLKLFLEKGYEQTTVLDIVASLGGLTRGAFYHHFKSKEEVLNAIFNSSFGDNDPFEKARKADVKNGLERVKMALNLALLSNIESEHRMMVSNLAITLTSNPRFMAEQVKGNQEIAAILTPMVEEGMRDGSIRPGNAKVLAGLFLLLTNFWLLPTFFPCDEEETYDKATLIKQIYDELGFPIIDEEMEAVFMRVFNKMEW